jgi:hypothetical protein
MSQSYEVEIPESVREAGRRAEALQAELLSSVESASQAGGSRAPAEAEGAGGFGGGSPAPAAQDSLTSGESASERAQSAPSQTTQTTQTTQITQTTQDTEEDLKRKLAQAQHELSTWRGRHTADTKRLTQQIEALTKQIDELRAASLPPVPDAPSITDEERTAYGDDLLDVVKRQSLVAVLPALKALESRLMAQIESLRGTATVFREETEAAKRERFFAFLDAQIPEWRDIDPTPEFQSWLAEYDPLLRRTRKEVLDEAVGMYDGESTAAFVRTYLSQRGGSGPQVRRTSVRSGAPQPAPATGYDPRAAAGQEDADEPTDLMDFAAPGKARSPRLFPQKPPAAKIWSLDEIKRTYAEIGRGAYRDDPARQKALEYEMAAAQREGRVRI